MQRFVDQLTGKVSALPSSALPASTRSHLITTLQGFAGEADQVPPQEPPPEGGEWHRSHCHVEMHC